MRRSANHEATLIDTSIHVKLPWGLPCVVIRTQTAQDTLDSQAHGEPQALAKLKGKMCIVVCKCGLAISSGVVSSYEAYIMVY